MDRIQWATSVVTIAIAIAMVVGTAGAADLTWDPGGGGSSDGAGTWLGAGEWWNGGANVDWSNSNPDNATIGNSGVGGAITLGAVTAGSVTVDNFTGAYTLSGGSLSQSGGITVGAGAGELTINTDITGSGGLTVNSPNRTRLGNSNSHTQSGDTVISGGELLDYQFNSLGSGNLNINGGVLVGYWGETMSRTLGLGAGQVQVPGGESGFCGQGATGSTIKFNNSDSFVVQWGGPLFNPSTLVLQTPWANTNGKLTWRNKLDLNGAPRTIAVNKDHAGKTDGYAQIISEISNSDAVNPASLTKTGVGRLILSAANTYDGGTTVSEGIMYYQRADAMPPTGHVAFADGTALEIEVGGSGNFSDAASGAGSLGGLLTGTAGGGGGTVSYAGDIAMTWYVSGTLNYAGPVSAAGGNISSLLIRGGTLTLSGSGSSYSGPTRIGLPSYATTVILGSSTALPSGIPLTVDSSGVSTLDLNGYDATLGLLSLGSNNGGARGQVADAAGTGTLTLTNGVFCDDHNNGNGGIFAGFLDLNGATQTFSVRDGTQTSDLLVSSAMQNGGLIFDAVEPGAGLELSGTNTYTGGTQVSGGTLIISGSLGGSAMDISGGTVEGTGALTFNISGSTFDQIVMTGGDLDILALTLNVNPSGASASEYVIVDATGGGTISGPFLNDPPSGWEIEYTPTASSPTTITLIPPPSSTLMTIR
ncbi:MAG: hypothetical protein HN919_22130 [Verrucomicrobia bacterium]|nr:hypothetical protein [Verrucomicrobiota bacterium]MBT7069012.1 hypothetical protein [Verrucomicrobiota bacterium]MBT7700118.1 hypothetical protein [Verrucomicrobiota bacterium]